MMTYRENNPRSVTDGIGLVSTLSSIPDIPWNTISDDEKKNLERAYGLRSGFKEILSTFSVIDNETVAQVLAAMFTQKWTRLFNDYALEYNQLDAYKVTEDGHRLTEKESTDTFNHGKTTQETSTDTGSVTTTDADTFQHGKVVNQSGTDSGTVSTSANDNVDNSEAIYGFNSGTSVPSTESSEDSESSSTETRDLANSNVTTNSGSDTRDRTEVENRDLSGSTTVSTSGADSKVIDATENENYGYTKSGNIGYTTPQELIRQDISLWAMPFFEIVFQDIDNSIMISVY